MFRGSLLTRFASCRMGWGITYSGAEQGWLKKSARRVQACLVIGEAAMLILFEHDSCSFCRMTLRLEGDGGNTVCNDFHLGKIFEF